MTRKLISAIMHDLSITMLCEELPNENILLAKLDPNYYENVEFRS